MIFDLQGLILQFASSEGGRNFDLYVDILNSSMKYIFALNHYNYVYWLSIHADNLLKLEYMSTDVSEEFCYGHFVKTKSEICFHLQYSIKPTSRILLL